MTVPATVILLGCIAFGFLLGFIAASMAWRTRFEELDRRLDVALLAIATHRPTSEAVSTFEEHYGPLDEPESDPEPLTEEDIEKLRDADLSTDGDP